MKFAMQTFSKGASVVVLIFISFASIFLIVKRSYYSLNEQNEDNNIGKVVKSLERIQKDLNVFQEYRRKEMVKIVQNKIPWLPKRYTVPNLIINSHSVIMQKSEKDNRTLVFVHQSRSAGSHVIDCLSNISYAKNIPMSPLMNSKNRLLWDSGNPDTTSYQDRIRIHRGQFSFGLCERIGKKCNYFSMFRDPFDSLVSLYNHCLSDNTNELCTLAKSSSNTLRDWIIQNSDLLFSQFLFSSHLCSKYFNITSVKDESLLQNMPCWYKQKLFHQQHLNPDEKDLVTNFIAKHLRNWFSVVGLFEKFDESMEMFEHVFGETFTKCSSNRDSRFKEYIDSNKAHPLSVDVRADDYDDETEDDLQMLRDDIEVQEALSHDYKIYNEIKRIYNMQRQILYNKLHNS